MKHFALLFLFVLSAAALSGAPLTPVRGRVVKAPLNVRAGAGMEYTVVGRLALNNPVEITAVGKEWLEIRAPENTATWIMARYIRNNHLTCGVVLRAGPGIGYEALGSAKAGMTVKVEGQTTPGGWVLIRPFYWTRVYVGRKAVEADEKVLAGLPPLPRPAPRPRKEIAKLESCFSKPPELQVAMTGYLYPAESGKSAITHVLYQEQEKSDELVPAAFVAPLEGDWSKFNEKKVTVTGCRGVNTSWDLPILIADKIRAAR